MYADLCTHLLPVSPKFTIEGDKNPKDFRRVLIERCQRSFQNKQRPKNFNPAEITDPEELVEMLEQAKKIRDLNVGNVKFIGALFKKGLVNERVMHICLAALINTEDEEGGSSSALRLILSDLEDFCHLMKSIGPTLDQEKAAPIMENYFSRYSELFILRQLF